MATSIGSFWRRWHITMSSFFRNYLYIPLASSWNASATVNLLIVFVAIGLWHGAGTNFVVYGLIHGSLVAYERFKKDRRTRQNLPPKEYRGAALAGRIALIFSIVVLSRILFRSPDFASASTYLSLMLSSPGTAFPLTTTAAAVLAIAALMHFSPLHWRDSAMHALGKASEWKVGLAFVAMLYVGNIFTQSSGGFIYFRF
jgi:D-alanyl-lipoteichoic acid acyltransferase DltB (MBOAT superfamily)